MDRASLERLLGMGLSLEQIAERFDRHPSTVGYWVRKHGLEAVNRERHAAKGGLERAELEALIAQGLSIAEMADRLGVSRTTVGYWLRRHELRTLQATRRAQARRAKAEGRATVTLYCRHHGRTEFWLEGPGRVPLPCVSEGASGRAATTGEGDPRRRGWWEVPKLRL